MVMLAARRGACVLALLTASAAVATTTQGAQLAAITGLATSLLERAEAVSTVFGAFLLICLAASMWRRPDRAPQAVEMAQLEVAAQTDSLTGLGNLRSFHHDLSLEIQRRTTTGTCFALMAIDLDGLKQINDTNGHQAGDVYIKRVCEAIRAATGDEGMVYRIGGDEFMVLLPGRRNWHGLTLAQKINDATRAAVGHRAVSIGLAESTGTESRQTLIHQADLALYEAKRTRLTSLTYHAGLAPTANVAVGGPSHHQKSLAAALARTVDAKDVGTRSHSETVAELCVGIGQRLGLSGDGLERLRLAGLLHDVGTIGVSEAIFQKSSALGAEERDEMRKHVGIGHGILVSAELAVEAEWVFHHHERCDGAGYPARLSSGEIPIQSKIIAVADAFEAMTGERPYRTSISAAEALEELQCNVGSQFDGHAVLALVDVVGQSATVTAPRRERSPAPVSRVAKRAIAPALAGI